MPDPMKGRTDDRNAHVLAAVPGSHCGLPDRRALTGVWFQAPAYLLSRSCISPKDTASGHRTSHDSTPRSWPHCRRTRSVTSFRRRMLTWPTPANCTTFHWCGTGFTRISVRSRTSVSSRSGRDAGKQALEQTCWCRAMIRALVREPTFIRASHGASIGLNFSNKKIQPQLADRLIRPKPVQWACVQESHRKRRNSKRPVGVRLRADGGPPEPRRVRAIALAL